MFTCRFHENFLRCSSQYQAGLTRFMGWWFVQPLSTTSTSEVPKTWDFLVFGFYMFPWNCRFPRYSQYMLPRYMFLYAIYISNCRFLYVSICNCLQDIPNSQLWVQYGQTSTPSQVAGFFGALEPESLWLKLIPAGYRIPMAIESLWPMAIESLWLYNPYGLWL